MQRIIDVTKKIFAVVGIATIAALVCTTHSNAGASVAPADAAATFKSKCSSCHGADGGGQTAAGKKMHLKDMRAAEVQGMSDDQLLAIISKGKGKMPGYEKSLGAETCKALVAYIRSLKK
jgi:cytochrome c6